MRGCFHFPVQPKGLYCGWGTCPSPEWVSFTGGGGWIPSPESVLPPVRIHPPLLKLHGNAADRAYRPLYLTFNLYNYVPSDPKWEFDAALVGMCRKKMNCHKLQILQDFKLNSFYNSSSICLQMKCFLSCPPTNCEQWVTLDISRSIYKWGYFSKKWVLFSLSFVFY